MAKSKYYGIQKPTPHVVASWPECQKLVTGVSGAIYKGFPTRSAAEVFAYGHPLDDDQSQQSVETDPNYPITIYTDGSSLGNPGAGGWAIVVIEGDSEDSQSGAGVDVTNNQMELTGLYHALVYAQSRAMNTHIICDSKYCVQGWSEWMDGWATRGWKTANGDPVKNADKWKYLHKLKASLSIKVKLSWTKGHADNQFNNRADELARAEAETQANLNLA